MARSPASTPLALASTSPLLYLSLLLAACSGQIGPDANQSAPGNRSGSQTGGAPPGSPGGPSGMGASPTPGAPAAPAVPGSAPLRRLTVKEYTNTVRDLLGSAAVPPRDFASDQDAAGFAIGGPVSTSTDVSKLVESADQIATAAAAQLPGLLPCPNVAPTGEAACARTFIQQFGKRAFRRPLAADEVDDLQAVYGAHRDPAIGAPFAEAIRAVVAAMLSSPFFLYRAELGPARPQRDGAAIRFNSYEIASRLSYGLWATMPDDTLFAEADANRLQTPEQIDQQARRMLKDPRTRETVADFHLQWLEIAGLRTEAPKDAHFKEYTPELVEAMLAETTGFVDGLLVGPGATGNLTSFFTAAPAATHPGLAKLYGPDAARQRAGILTQASFLAMHAEGGESHPVKRGAAALRRVFCIDIPPPPDMAVGEPKEPAPGTTTRARFAEHAKQACASCHRMTDPVGFAFEHYDAIGAYRTLDQGRPVDATGEIELPSGRLRWNDAVELSRQLPDVKEVRQCLATQWLRFMLRRNEFDGDRPALESAQAALAGSSLDLREMLVALVKSRAFTHRLPSPGEVSP